MIRIIGSRALAKLHAEIDQQTTHHAAAAAAEVVNSLVPESERQR